MSLTLRAAKRGVCRGDAERVLEPTGRPIGWARELIAAPGRAVPLGVQTPAGL